MTDASHEGQSTSEPKLDETVLAQEAERLTRELTEALMTLPQYRVAKRQAEKTGYPIIKFDFDGFECEDGTYYRDSDRILSRDLTMNRIVDGRNVVDSYSVDTLTDAGKAAVSRGAYIPPTEIIVIHSDGTDAGSAIETRTQTAIDMFDKLIERVKTAPRLHVI